MQKTPYPASYLHLLRLPVGVAIRAGIRPEAGSGCGSVQGVGDFTVPEGPAGHQESFHASSAVSARGLREEEKEHISRLFMAPRSSGKNFPQTLRRDCYSDPSPWVRAGTLDKEGRGRPLPETATAV